MAELFGFMDGYSNFMEKYTDPRTKDWLLVGKPGHLAIILVSYVYFCTKAGPRYMRDKKPYDLKTTIQVYNLLQVISSIYLVYEAYHAGWGGDYSYSCQGVVPGPKGLRMAKGVWLYFICKLIELLDTLFFILRKKYNQVSYLHLYHHSLMPVCAWIGVTFLPGGHGTLLGYINSMIHVIMYSYYFLSSLGPQYQKYLWWKKYLTGMQMIQFCIIFHHNAQVLFRECEYPKVINFLLATQAAYFLYLFGQFYIKQYHKARKVSEANANLTGQKVKVKNNNIANGKIPNGDSRDANKRKIKAN